MFCGGFGRLGIINLLILTKHSDFSHHLVNMFIDFSQKVINTLRVNFICGPVGEEDILQGLEIVVIADCVFDLIERSQIGHPAHQLVPAQTISLKTKFDLLIYYSLTR